jgi:polysaccharide export outer membrane protein
VLNVSSYSQGLANQREEDEDDSRRTLTAPFYPNTDLDFKFLPGSAIQVTIWQEPDLIGNFSIDSQGYVILPLIGKVNVIRFTPESLKSYLKEEYSSYLRNPIIQILPLIRVSVLGFVLKPGLYRVEPDRPLWDVIELAGGPTEKGDVMRMSVMRGGLTINENLLDAYEKGISLREIGVESGDQLLIRHRKGPFPWRTLLSLASLSVSIWAIATRR